MMAMMEYNFCERYDSPLTIGVSFHFRLELLPMWSCLRTPQLLITLVGGRDFQRGEIQPKQADGKWPHVSDRWCAISHRLAGYSEPPDGRNIDHQSAYSTSLPVEPQCTPEGCRYDIVRRPVIVVNQSFGGSNDTLSTFMVYTWSQDIFRHHTVDDFIPPRLGS